MAKKEITAKKVGKKVVMVIDDQKYTKVFATKEEQDDVMAKATAYNTKNSVKAAKELVTIMSADVEAKKEEVKQIKEKASAKPKALPKEAEKVIPVYEIEKAVMFLLEKGYSVQKTQEAPKRGRESKGEY